MDGLENLKASIMIFASGTKIFFQNKRKRFVKTDEHFHVQENDTWKFSSTKQLFITACILGCI